MWSVDLYPPEAMIKAPSEWGHWLFAHKPLLDSQFTQGSNVLTLWAQHPGVQGSSWPGFPRQAGMTLPHSKFKSGLFSLFTAQEHGGGICLETAVTQRKSSTEALLWVYQPGLHSYRNSHPQRKWGACEGRAEATASSSPFRCFTCQESAEQLTLHREPCIST